MHSQFFLARVFRLPGNIFGRAEALFSLSLPRNMLRLSHTDELAGTLSGYRSNTILRAQICGLFGVRRREHET
jgi:hypothetical protein